jgi:hypothetical protein
MKSVILIKAKEKVCGKMKKFPRLSKSIVTYFVRVTRTVEDEILSRFDFLILALQWW